MSICICDGLVTHDLVGICEVAKLTAAQDRLVIANESVEDVANQMRLWIRLAALVGFPLCFWGLWAQVALARRGWTTRAASPGAI